MKNLKIVFALLILVGSTYSTFGQVKYFTRDGKVSFLSKASVEDIEAVNKKVTCVVDAASGQIEMAMLIRAFEFDKELMKEHFNENYLESEKFPKATFKGSISNFSDIKWTTDGTYPVKLTGQLTIHGVTKDMSSSGSILVKGGKITAASEFLVSLSDYNVKVEKAYASKISEKVKISVDLPLTPMAK